MWKAGRPVRALGACVLLLSTLMLTGCMTVYVDGGLKNASAAEISKPVRPSDAQLLFTFQSKGAANARATDMLKEEVSKLVSSSGLFAVVGPDPSLSGAILSITINNVPITSENDAMAKGFATGFTFGLVGSAVTDGYICTIDYVPPGGAKITKTARHAIHTTMGAKGAPANAVKAKSIDEAVRTMTRQILTEGLKQLSQEPVFASQVSS